MSRDCLGLRSHPITLILGPLGGWLGKLLGTLVPKASQQQTCSYSHSQGLVDKPPEVWGFGDPSLVSLPGQSGRLEISGPFPATRPSSKHVP